MVKLPKGCFLCGFDNHFVEVFFSPRIFVLFSGKILQCEESCAYNGVRNCPKSLFPVGYNFSESIYMKVSKSKRMVIILIVLAFIFLVTGGYLLGRKRLGIFLEEEGSEIVAEDSSSVVKAREFTFLDDEEGDIPPVRVEYLTIVSSGNIYGKEISVGGGNVKLFILEAYYGTESQEIDAVVAIQYTEDYEKILNWWVYNLVIEEIDVEDLGNDLFDKEYLESIFTKNTAWEYAYYSDYSIPTSENYLGVLDEVMGGIEIEDIAERLSSGDTEDLILMPYLIYEVKNEE